MTKNGQRLAALKNKYNIPRSDLGQRGLVVLKNKTNKTSNQTQLYSRKTCACDEL